MYITGAFYAISVIAAPEGATVARHYNECVAKAKLSTGQLAQNMKEYAETQPDAPSKTVPTILVRYLISLCGLPTAQ